MCSACSSGSRCWRPSAWGRPARCSTAWPSSSPATGATAAALQAHPASDALQSAASARLVRDRLAAGAPHGVRLRGGRQLRGGDRLLAPRRAALSGRQRRHDPGRRPAGAVDVRLGGEALRSAFTPNGSQTFSAAPAGDPSGRRREHPRPRRRAGPPAQRRRPGLALGGAVDAAAGAADAGQLAGVGAGHPPSPRRGAVQGATASPFNTAAVRSARRTARSRCGTGWR